MHLDDGEGVARLDERSPRRMTAAWLGLDESDLAEVSDRVVAALADRMASLAELREMARTDPLTHIGNRRAAEERLTDECARARRHRRALAVILIDVDGLKGVNDTLGHAAGDQLLGEVASRLQGSLRVTDFAARWGGDEFLVICPETTGTAAQRLCMKLRSAVAGRLMMLAGHERRVRISAGWAIGEATGDPAAMLAAADASLYRQKRHRSLTGRRTSLVRVLPG